VSVESSWLFRAASCPLVGCCQLSILKSWSRPADMCLRNCFRRRGAAAKDPRLIGAGKRMGKKKMVRVMGKILASPMVCACTACSSAVDLSSC
jgi:hypothetical protein